MVEALEDNELSIAIWHRSEQDLDKVLRESPQLINQINGLVNTPLHLAVDWPYGIRALLQHGAYVDAIDQKGWTPLRYAIEMGISETVSVLVKADCSLCVGGWCYVSDLLTLAVLYLESSFHTWLVTQEVRNDVLDVAILLLAERRRNLQSRLAASSAAVSINPKVFQADRVLDEYAQYAECVEKDTIRSNEQMPRHVSSLLPECRTVYHVMNLTVDIAEKLWQNGFRDIDVADVEGMTPLMRCQNLHLNDAIEVSSWLIVKGAKLQRPQYVPLGYTADPTSIFMESPSGIRALHYVAYNIGSSARDLVWHQWDEQSAPGNRRLQIELHRLSKEARLLATDVFLDVSSDSCICACSSQGCLASTMVLKVLGQWYRTAKDRRKWFLQAAEFLIDLVGPSDSCPHWLAKEIIRFQTFTELELRHTCCDWAWHEGFIERYP